MGNFRLFFSSVLFFVMISGCAPCDDDSGTSNDNYFTQNFGSEVSRDFIGQIVDQNGSPIQNAEVKIGTATTQTDVNGVFIINRANVYTRFAYITAKKDGFIDGSRAMVPTSGKNNVKIMLISNAPVRTISSGVASEVTLPNGTKVTFDGAFQDESGNAYSGSVQVAMFHLEASNENLSSLMPGMLYAKDSNGQEKVLETYGMLNVELKGSNGQKLQIASRHTAQITMPIDPTQLASAPNAIPLWHFDEEKGYWIEEWSATRVGNNYVGNVSHFSWWNCDYPYDTVTLTINLVDTEGNPIPNATVILSLGENDFGRTGFTDNLGNVSGVIPANEPLNTAITLGNGCGLIHSSVLGPFTSNTTITLTVDLDTTTVKLQGSLLNCNSGGVTVGYFILHYNGGEVSFVPVVNGFFSTYVGYCNSNSSFSLRGYDLEENMISQIYNGTFTTETIHVGSLIACTSSDCIYNLEGSYTVVVTRSDNGAVYTFPNEIIHRIAENQYKTTTTGNFTASELQLNDAGFYFNVNSCQDLTVPSQNLAAVYSNIVRGNLSNNTIDGQIIATMGFQLNYEIVFATDVRTFTAVYTRN